MCLTRSLPAVFFWLLFGSQAMAQPSFQVIHSFSDGPFEAFGKLLDASDGLLYGTTLRGGPDDLGTVFTVRRHPGGALTINSLHSFSGADGARPMGGLIEAGGRFYGTTERGGVHNLGTVFRMTPEGAVTVLHSFNGTDGAGPLPLMRARDGNFYGMTPDIVDCGGVMRETGVIYRITPEGLFTLLRVLNPSCMFTTEGTAPRGTLVQGPDGDFYGTTSGGGGTFVVGTFFKLTATGELTTLYRFTFPFVQPAGELVLGSDGNFYGSTIEFGGNAAFRITPEGSIAFLHAFTGEHDGTGRVLLEGSDGRLLVSTGSALFWMTKAGAMTLFHRFSEFVGGCCVGAEAIQARDGRIYLMTFGGVTGRGGVVAITPGGALTGWNALVVDDKPAGPVGPLVPDDDGGFYGTSCRGGFLNAGTIFRMTSAGAVSTLHSFGILDGSCPLSLFRAVDRNLYGVTVRGGFLDAGTIFRITPEGIFTLLRVFAGLDGTFPMGLMQAADGTFYGTTVGGGLSNRGTIFRITPAGTFASLHSFVDTACGPFSAPVQAPDGNLYGTTGLCLPPRDALYRMTPAGVVTILRTGRPNPLVGPGGLIVGADGLLYGTIQIWNNFGALFVSTLDGDVTPLHTFTAAEGLAPAATLVQAPDGALYGTAIGLFFTNPANMGTIFKARVDGTFTVLHTFTGPDGATPFGPLTRTSDGAFYGTTYAGGRGNRGVIFRIVPE